MSEGCKGCRWENLHPMDTCYKCRRSLSMSDNYEPAAKVLSAEEWLEERKHKYLAGEGCEWSSTFTQLVKEAFKAGAAENEKKHRQKQTFDEWWEYSKIRLGESLKESMQRAWIARGKAHNLEEDTFVAWVWEYLDQDKTWEKK